jgi:hypothetical protein
MAAVQVLALALLQERGYTPLQGGDRAGLDFLAAKDHWGSVLTLGMLRADGLAPSDLARRAEAFHALVAAQRAHAATLVVRPTLGASHEVALGSFGILLLVHEGGAPPGAVEHARGLKRGGLREKTSSLVWTVDAPLRRVWGHRGLPLAGLDPPRRWVEQVLGR